MGLGFKEWLKLNEAGTIKARPKGITATKNPFAGFRGQLWGPASKYYHDPDELMTPIQKVPSAFLTGIGSSFIDSLGYTPESWPSLQGPPNKDGGFAERSVTMPLVIPLLQGDETIESKINGAEWITFVMDLLRRKEDRRFFQWHRYPKSQEQIDQERDELRNKGQWEEDPAFYTEDASKEMAQAKAYTQKLLEQQAKYESIREAEENGIDPKQINYSNPETKTNLQTGQDSEGNQITYMSAVVRFSHINNPKQAPHQGYDNAYDDDGNGIPDRYQAFYPPLGGDTSNQTN